MLNKQTLEFLGLVGIHSLDTKFPEYGIWLKKSAHGNGFGKEAVHALNDWMEKNWDYEYIIYPVDVRNTCSRKIPISLGGKEFRQYEAKNMSGNILQMVEYHIYKNKE